MKMTLDLPDDLAKRVKLLAVHEDQKLKDTVAALLRRGLATTAATRSRRTVVKADKAMLKRRREIGAKFISGEWSAGLAGFEEGRAADRKSARERDGRWRD